MAFEDDGISKGRKSSLLNMAAKVALKQGKNLIFRAAEDRLKNMVSQADIIVAHVGKLKGAAMKAVQMLTIEGQDFLPPEVLKVLETLQSQSQPLPNEKMHQRIREELGEERFQRLKNISSEPIAAASIGQVYLAELDGEKVVVKVQYPGIADSVDSDLGILKKLVQGLLFVSRKEVNIDELFVEVTRILKLETDYLNERDCLLAYQDGFSEHSDYRIPKVFSEMTTSQVITMSFEEGLEFPKWLDTEPAESSKKKIGDLFLDLYQIEFFKNRLVQTDPNPANFLVTAEDELVLLDFGATLHYDVKFVRQYMSLLNCVFSDGGDVLEKLLDLEFIDSRESDETKQEFVNFLKMSLSPFEPERQPFDFGNQEYVAEVRTKAAAFSKKIQYSAPPKQIIFLHRKLGGIFQLLRMLDAKIDLTRFVESLLASEIEGEPEVSS